MIRAGICCSRNDATSKLVKILLFHPDVNLVWVCDGEKEERLDKLYPWLTGDTTLATRCNLPDTFQEVDVIFVLRDIYSKAIDAMQLPEGVRLIYLDGIHNLDDAVTYGLAEINRKYIVHDCSRVCVPGAVAHVMELALLPLAKNLMLTGNVEATVQTDKRFYVESISREVTRLLKGIQSSFNRNVECRQGAGPIVEGAIVITVYTPCVTDLAVVRELYESHYDDHNFTYIIDFKPAAQDVIGTNKCLMFLQREQNQIIVTAAIDATLKGGVGTAVHDMNLLFGLHERVGLETF